MGDYGDISTDFEDPERINKLAQMQALVANPPVPRVLDKTYTDLNNGHGEVGTGSNALGLQDSQEGMRQWNQGRATYENSISQVNQVTPGQSVMSALLAAIPTVGGALIGAAIGRPKLSEHARFTMKDLQGSPTGWAGGLQEGAAIGQETSQDFLKKLRFDNEQKAKLQENLGLQQMAFGKDQLDAGMREKSNAAQKEDQNQLYQEQREPRLQDEIRAASARARIERENRAPTEAESKAQILKDLLNKGVITPQQVTERQKQEALGLTPTNKPLATDAQKQAAASELIDLLGDNPDAEKIKNIQANIGGSVTQDELLKNTEYARRLISSKRAQTGQNALQIDAATRETIAGADTLPSQYKRILELRDEAFKALGPGMANAYARKGWAALPANVQNELLSNVDALSISAAKAAGAGQVSDQERQAFAGKYKAALERGKLDEVLANDINIARTKAISRLEQAVISGNENAKKLLDAKKQAWGMNETDDQRLDRLGIK